MERASSLLVGFLLFVTLLAACSTDVPEIETGIGHRGDSQSSLPRTTPEAGNGVSVRPDIVQRTVRQPSSTSTMIKPTLTLRSSLPTLAPRPMGVSVRADRACPSVDAWRVWAEAHLDGDYALSQSVIVYGCTRVVQGTYVVGPLETVSFTISGQTFTQSLGELADGTRLWFSEGHVRW